MNKTDESLFDKSIARYKNGEDACDLIKDFEDIVDSYPNNSAGWTCLSWLQLLSNRSNEALRSARFAVKLNAQDPQARINLSLALLETSSKGVREHIDLVKRAILVMPEIEKDLKESIDDGLKRKPDWESLKKIKNWLDL